MIGWVVGGVMGVLLLLEVLKHVPTRHRDLRTSVIRGLLSLLYTRGEDGARLTILVRDSALVMHVEKCVRAVDVIELVLSLPADSVKAVGRERVAAGLQQYGSVFSPDHGGEVRINCGNRLTHAVAVVEQVLKGIYGAKPERRECVATMVGVKNPWAHPGLSERPESWV